jgi:hypothetical protein
MKKGPGTAAPATASATGHQARHPAPNRHTPLGGCIACIKAEEWMNTWLQVHLLLYLSISNHNTSYIISIF